MPVKFLTAFFLGIIVAVLVFGASFFYWSEAEVYRELELSIAKDLQAKLAAIRISTQVRIVEAERDKNVTLLFVGDVMLSRGIEAIVKKYGRGDWRYPFLNVAETIQTADLVFGNLEGPISSRGKNQGSEYSFRAQPEAVEGLKFAGFDVLSLANNHIIDWGPEALADTIEILKANGIHPVGAGRDRREANEPLVVKVKNTKLAFLAYTTLFPKSFELERVKAKIKEIKTSKLADLIILSLHWGEEYAKQPSAEQIAIGHKLIEAGADLIVGHHPHVVQEMEYYKGGWIAYSLGNFVFDQNFDEATSRGLMLKVIVQNKEIKGVEEILIKFTKTFQPHL